MRNILSKKIACTPLGDQLEPESLLRQVGVGTVPEGFDDRRDSIGCAVRRSTILSSGVGKPRGDDGMRERFARMWTPLCTKFLTNLKILRS
jgi:hypothetical protein